MLSQKVAWIAPVASARTKLHIFRLFLIVWEYTVSIPLFMYTFAFNEKRSPVLLLDEIMSLMETCFGFSHLPLSIEIVHFYVTLHGNGTVSTHFILNSVRLVLSFLWAHTEDLSRRIGCFFLLDRFTYFACVVGYPVLCVIL